AEGHLAVAGWRPLDGISLPCAHTQYGTPYTYVLSRDTSHGTLRRRGAAGEHAEPARPRRNRRLNPRRPNVLSARSQRETALSRWRSSSASGRRAQLFARLAPARRALLEEGAEALLPLVARAALGDPAGRFGAVRP